MKRPKRTGRVPLKVLPPPTAAMSAFMGGAMTEAAPLPPEPAPAPEPAAEPAPLPPEPTPAPETAAEPTPGPPRRVPRMRGLVPRAAGDRYKLPVLLQPPLARWFKQFAQENEVHMSALAEAAVAPLIEELRALPDPTPEAIRMALAQGERFRARVAAAVYAILARAPPTDEDPTS
jgi:hypothetical protein